MEKAENDPNVRGIKDMQTAMPDWLTEMIAAENAVSVQVSTEMQVESLAHDQGYARVYAHWTGRDYDLYGVGRFGHVLLARQPTLPLAWEHARQYLRFE